MICLHLVNESKLCISHLQLPNEIEADEVESDEIADTIRDVSDAYICDLFTPN